MKVVFLSVLLAVVLWGAVPDDASAQSVIWDVVASVSDGVDVIIVSGSVLLPRSGGTASFVSGIATVNVTTTSSTITVSGSGIQVTPDGTCTGQASSGSLAITTGSTGLSASGTIAGSVTCTGLGTFAFVGSGTATVRMGTNDMTISSLTGTSTVVHNGVTFTAVSGLLLTQGDRIKTGASGAATLTFTDGSTMTVSASSEVVLQQEGGTSGVATILNNVLGTIDLTVTCAQTFLGCYQVTTPSATYTVQGTRFNVAVSLLSRSVTSTMNVVSGTVVQTDNTGKATTLATGQQGTVTATLPAIVSAVLPSSRAVEVTIPATAFATIVNPGPGSALGCALTPPASLAATFSYQTTNPSTNAVTGTANTPVTIASGQFQTFIFSVTPTAVFVATDVQIGFVCSGSNSAPVVTGLNTLLLSASSVPVADVIALAATTRNDGTVHVPGAGTSAAFAVATVNLGKTDTITASVDTGSTSLPVSLSICQTNSSTGQCLATAAASVTTSIAANATPTFGIFVTASATVPFDPAGSRVSVRFKDGNGVTRGSTSVAVTTQ